MSCDKGSKSAAVWGLQPGKWYEKMPLPSPWVMKPPRCESMVVQSITSDATDTDGPECSTPCSRQQGCYSSKGSVAHHTCDTTDKKLVEVVPLRYPGEKAELASDEAARVNVEANINSSANVLPYDVIYAASAGMS